MTLPVLVDTHAHLDLPEFEPDLAEVLGRAAAAGVGRILTVGIDLASSRAAVELADRHQSIWAAVGVHPNEARGWGDALLRELTSLLRHPKVAAVGETGLDLYRDRVPRELQEAAFRDHLDLAREAGLPVVVHARQAHRRVLDILATRPGTRGVLHCFAGTVAEALEARHLGLLLSFGGPLTYPNAAVTREAVAALPWESLLLETDCPYLPPQGRRGRRNEPAWVAAAAEAMAACKGTSPEEAARLTTVNAGNLFGLGIPAPG